MWMILFQRQRKLLKRFDKRLSLYYHQTPKELYRVIYFETYDKVKSVKNSLVGLSLLPAIKSNRFINPLLPNVLF